MSNKVVKNNADKICLLIDVEVTSDRNVIQNEAERKLKYKTLVQKIRECFVIPVIIRTLAL
jgi:hypothetical protein